jgi:hypothetical protein
MSDLASMREGWPPLATTGDGVGEMPVAKTRVAHPNQI